MRKLLSNSSKFVPTLILLLVIAAFAGCSQDGGGITPDSDAVDAQVSE
jgi:predicted small lipoprotein YifL